jgi:hypothetical protein
LDEVPEAASTLISRIDPLGLRDLDFIADRAAQLEAFARIYAAEALMVGRQRVPHLDRQE